MIFFLNHFLEIDRRKRLSEQRCSLLSTSQPRKRNQSQGEEEQILLISKRFLCCNNSTQNDIYISRREISSISAYRYFYKKFQLPVAMNRPFLYVHSDLLLFSSVWCAYLIRSFYPLTSFISSFFRFYHGLKKVLYMMDSL